MRAEKIGERLSKRKALAIFSSDAISSSAYATEEILRALVVGGIVALTIGLEVSIAIALLLIVVAITVRLLMQDFAVGGWAWILFSSFQLLLPGAVLALFALAGVWWGRRQERDPAPHGVDG